MQRIARWKCGFIVCLAVYGIALVTYLKIGLQPSTAYSKENNLRRDAQVAVVIPFGWKERMIREEPPKQQAVDPSITPALQQPALSSSSQEHDDESALLSKETIPSGTQEASTTPSMTPKEQVSTPVTTIPTLTRFEPLSISEVTTTGGKQVMTMPLQDKLNEIMAKKAERENAKQTEKNHDLDAAITAMQNDSSRSTWTIEDHRHEMERLQAVREQSEKEAKRLQNELDAVVQLYEEEAAALESKLALKIPDLRKESSHRIDRKLECVGWKQTCDCDPYGKREPKQDKTCHQLISGGVSGYCEVRDPETDEHFRVMQLNCSSVRGHVKFSCDAAVNFANFAVRMAKIVEDAQNASLTESLAGNNGTGDGIVMVVYPKLMTSAYATIRALRSYNCTLPIEIWTLDFEFKWASKAKTILNELETSLGPISRRSIKDLKVQGFATKIHAIINSQFENVLFLDADNVPMRDPTSLFRSKEFQNNSAIFWPDFWHPKNTIFNIHEHSLLWQLVDMEPIDMFEQESGQIMINRKKSAVALELLRFFATHKPNHFDTMILAHGDKDLFRLAWLKTETPFHMIPFPPGAAGAVRNNKFCGMTMVQYDPDGSVLFLHRNAKKLYGNARSMDQSFWTHLQSFKWGTDLQDDNMMSYEEMKEKYIIGIQSSGPTFSALKSCYGAESKAIQHFQLTAWEDLPFPNIENEIIQYAHDAALLS